MSTPVESALTEDGHRLDLLVGPDDYFPVACAAMRGAQSRIWVDTYVYNDDGVGRALGEILRAKAKRGVDARLLYDPSGSLHVNADYLDHLQRDGVAVRRYGHGGFLRVMRPGVREHSHLAVVDDQAYVGGHNWSSPWGAPPDGGGWHDVSVRVRGELVREFRQLYERRWREAKSGRVRNFDTGAKYDSVRLMADGPFGRSSIHKAHVFAFNHARSRVWLEHAYFFPTRSFRRALYDAVSRGVDVRFLLAGETDLPPMARAARHEYARWMRAGIKIYEYQDSILHSKYALVDDDWAVVGSYNAVPSATVLSLEAALVVTDRPFVAEVANQFERDLRKSTRVRAHEVAGRGASDRLLNSVSSASQRALALVLRGDR